MDDGLLNVCFGISLVRACYSNVALAIWAMVEFLLERAGRYKPIPGGFHEPLSPNPGAFSLKYFKSYSVKKGYQKIIH